MNKNVTEIIKKGQKEGKTLAQISAELADAGYITHFGDKPGNAVLDSVVGDEPCTVEDGKLINGNASPHSDVVIYEGEEYHVDDDGVTLIAKPDPEAPWWAEHHTYGGLVPWQDELPKYIPDKGMMHRPEYAGKTVIKGKLRYRYDENGDASYEPVSMADYNRDHGRQ